MTGNRGARSSSESDPSAVPRIALTASRPDLEIGLEDVEWVARTLAKHGDRQAWDVARRLCP
jgi:hypothetical protein